MFLNCFRSSDDAVCLKAVRLTCLGIILESNYDEYMIHHDREEKSTNISVTTTRALLLLIIMISTTTTTMMMMTIEKFVKTIIMIT